MKSTGEKAERISEAQYRVVENRQRWNKIGMEDGLVYLSELCGDREVNLTHSSTQVHVIVLFLYLPH